MKGEVNWDLVREIRLKKGILQQDVSKALGKCNSYYCLVESNHFKLTLEAAKTIIAALELTPEESKAAFGICL